MLKSSIWVRNLVMIVPRLPNTMPGRAFRTGNNVGVILSVLSRHGARLGQTEGVSAFKASVWGPGWTPDRRRVLGIRDAAARATTRNAATQQAAIT